MSRPSDPCSASERRDAPREPVAAGTATGTDDERGATADRPGLGGRGLRYVAGSLQLLRPTMSPRLWRGLRYVAKSLQQIALCLILYVASAGPMYWRCYEAYYLNGSSLLGKLYLPLVFACRNKTALSEFMDWYVGLWIFPHATAVDPPPRPPRAAPLPGEMQDAPTAKDAESPT